MNTGKKFYETSRGVEIIREKIKKLDNDLSSAIPDALNKAASFGDRSENAEYDEAKRWQRDSQEEVGILKQYLSNVVVVEKQKSYDHVVFGSYVKVLENEIEKIYKIVGKYESDASKGLIFYSSPIGSMLLNKKIDDCFEFETPSKKTNEYQILDIGYYEDA
jgi:transcription elongation GreA/GreB family factor